MYLCNVIVICPFAPYGLAHRPKTSQIRQQLGHTLCNLYFPETAGCIYAIPSSMELSKPVVVQHHGHLTLTLGVVSRALQNNLAKIHNARNHIYGENFKLKFCTCAQRILSARLQSLHNLHGNSLTTVELLQSCTKIQTTVSKFFNISLNTTK